jgi:hypothetical protein
MDQTQIVKLRTVNTKIQDAITAAKDAKPNDGSEADRDFAAIIQRLERALDCFNKNIFK